MAHIPTELGACGQKAQTQNSSVAHSCLKSKLKLATFKAFRQLTEEWIKLALQAAKMKLQAAKEAEKPKSK